MIDVRSQLMRSSIVPQTLRRVTKSFTVHWNGPPVSSNELAQLKGDAKFHVQTRGWDGLSYHYAVGRSGTTYWCRDEMARLAHSGVAQGNSESLSCLVITGEGMDLPSIQIHALEEVIHSKGIPSRYVLGHQEWPRLTACPGPLLLRWLAEYRTRYITLGEATTMFTSNVRDEPSVLSHLVRTLPVGTKLKGSWMLGKPYKGDALWFQIEGLTDYLHASVLKGDLPIWTAQHS